MSGLGIWRLAASRYLRFHASRRPHQPPSLPGGRLSCPDLCCGNITGLSRHTMKLGKFLIFINLQSAWAIKDTWPAQSQLVRCPGSPILHALGQSILIPSTYRLQPQMHGWEPSPPLLGDRHSWPMMRELRNPETSDLIFGFVKKKHAVCNATKEV